MRTRGRPASTRHSILLLLDVARPNRLGPDAICGWLGIERRYLHKQICLINRDPRYPRIQSGGTVGKRWNWSYWLDEPWSGPTP